MKKYLYDIYISAQSQAESKNKKQALEKLSHLLSEKELSALVHVLENDPLKKELAKAALGI
jgi:hypothetical protein